MTQSSHQSPGGRRERVSVSADELISVLIIRAPELSTNFSILDISIGKITYSTTSYYYEQHKFYDCLTRVNEFGEAAHLLTVVRGQVFSTSLVFSSTLMIDSRVIPRRRGTSLLRPRIFS